MILSRLIFRKRRKNPEIHLPKPGEHVYSGATLDEIEKEFARQMDLDENREKQKKPNK